MRDEKRRISRNGGRILIGDKAGEYDANMGALYDGTLSKDTSVATTSTGETLFGAEADAYNQALADSYGWGH